MTRLRELAQLYSIQITYDDAAGKKRYATRESLLAALKMRIPEGADLDEALRLRKDQKWTRGIEPVTVVWGRMRPELELYVPKQHAGGTAEWTLDGEDGEMRSGTVELSAMERGEEHGGLVAVTVVIDRLFPHGYHTLRLEVGGQTFETFVISAPGKAFAPRAKAWGVFAPLYAAHTSRSWGTGDVGDLLAYTDWINSLGGGVVATLPMLAAYPDEPSPYSPVSRLFWNELYLDPRRLPEYDARDLDREEIERLQHSRTIEYTRAFREKRRVLERMAERFRPDDTFEEFAVRARDYAEFRAQQEQQDSSRYHLYVQYRMAQQMREVADAARRAGQGLYLDFPLGVNPGGFDAQKYARHFAKGISVGAPPDLFFTKGQNWGFPPLDPDAIRENRHEYFRASVRHHVEHAGILRIDHVMGLHRLFWIPDGGEAKDGVYVRYPQDELWAILMLESTRHQCMIVGEDLGTVPEEVPRAMARHGVRSMFVVQYAIQPEGNEPAGIPPAQSVASINTHDMPTFAGWWRERDIDDRLEQGLLDKKEGETERTTREQMRHGLSHFLEERGYLAGRREDAMSVLEGTLAFLASSPAEIVLVTLEDLWGETEPQNRPGIPERSWKQKLRYGLEQTREDATVKRILRIVHDRRRGVAGARPQEPMRRSHEERPRAEER
ncbi:MAG TPA: 4-alpha-glucanotransferase [Thermoanaerobaculia bacterium]